MSAAPVKTRRTKKAAPAVVEAVVEAAPEVAPLPNRVSLSDLWEMRLAQLEKRALLAEAEVARMTKLYALSKLDKQGIVLGLEKKMDTAKRQAEAAENRVLIAKKRMEGTLGRSLTNLAIDPDTGEIVNPE